MKKIIKWIFKLLPLVIFKFFQTKYYCLRKNKVSDVLLYRKNKKFLEKVCKAIGIEFIVDGLENLPVEESYLITPNHQSLIDPLIFFNIFNDPISFACKDSIKKLPIVNDIVYLCDGCYLERDNLRQEIKVMRYIRDKMITKNLRYIVFPEGTRTKNSDLSTNEFKPGAFKYTMDINKKIVPVCIYGSHRIFDKKIKDKKYTIYVSFLKPISKENYKEMSTSQVSELVKKQIDERLEQIKLILKY